MLLTMFGKDLHFSMISSVMHFTVAQLSLHNSGTTAVMYPLV
jgi:hypothetical protein